MLESYKEDYFKNRQKKFLNYICSDSHVCIAFGTATNNINNFFDEFNNFSLLSESPVSIGSKSANGFLKMLTFEKDKYIANTVLKSNQTNTADNLVYEGLVGLFLNKKGEIFPCFLETYGIYKFINHKLYNYFKNNKLVDKKLITNDVINKININIANFKSEACDNLLYNAIMIQHLKEAITLSDLLKLKKSDSEFIDYELPYILFQIYIPLSKLAKKFTHYDLHAYNVLLYTPNEYKYVYYHYHFDDGLVVSFKSKYIVKIIDYGRSFFKKNNHELGNSYNIYEHFKQKCSGMNYGFFVSSRHNLLPYQKNESYDLRLIGILKDNNDITVPTFLSDFFNKVTQYQIEKTTSGLPNDNNNVHDAATELINIVKDRKQSHDKYYEDLDTMMSKFGDLHIFMNGKKSMVFQKYLGEAEDSINQRDAVLYPKIKKISPKKNQIKLYLL
jgi:hypothetical protein